MAMLASQRPYLVPFNSSSSAAVSANNSSSLMAPAQYRVAGAAAISGHANVFTSPTESEFSDSFADHPVSVIDWDESRVGDWLKSINCGQYVDIFRQNHINGENLMEVDHATLKEMGIKKIGDRVRIATHAKTFRNTALRKVSRRSTNRLSLATLDGNATMTPPSGSPKPLLSARSGGSTRTEQRGAGYARSSEHKVASLVNAKYPSRSSSPKVESDIRRRAGAPSPLEMSREAGAGYFSQAPPTSARYIGIQNATLAEPPLTARLHSHAKSSPSIDDAVPHSAGVLPTDKPWIRVIFEGGMASVVSIDGFRTAEDIIRATLRKGSLNENHFRSYCFWLLDGTIPNATFCRRLGESELCRLCNDGVRSERGRFILRKIHAGEPDEEQLHRAAKIAESQQPEPPAIEVVQPQKNRSQLKIEKLTGEALAAVSYPMSPASQLEREQYFDSQLDASQISRNASHASTASARARKLKDFYGARPPTELITQDLQSYFPEVNKEDMDRTVRMSIARSNRLSRAMSRLSTVSDFSIAESLRDAPPLPTIADQWLRDSGGQPRLRPLSVVRLSHRDSSYRASISSSILSPLDEEGEPDRKSYVSFSADSTDASYYEDEASSPSGTEAGSGSFNARLSQFIAEDGEEPDEELMQHLEKDSWDDVRYMKGAMIGQGSFGTVFLALHAVTGELMAVKQVEMPSNSGVTMDARKNSMVDALKREITLLRELKHPNIVQYLGSNSDDQHLNIFLEYVAGGSVASMLVNYGSLGETLISNFVRQILQGLSYLHSMDIIHRDIKGANILVDNKGTVKISDFGISKRVEASTLLHPPPAVPGRGAGAAGRSQRVSMQGSVFWMAPEVVRQTAYTKKADIWSLGCLIVEMFTGTHPHPNCTQLQAIFKIGGSGSTGDGAGARPDLPSEASEAAQEFLRHTFELEHEKRPSAEQLMGYEFCELKS